MQISSAGALLPGGLGGNPLGPGLSQAEPTAITASVISQRSKGEAIFPAESPRDTGNYYFSNGKLIFMTTPAISV